MLNVSKLYQGQLHLNKTRFTVSKLIDDCCLHIRALGAYSIIKSGDMELQIIADSERVDQVIINMVNNAIKYAPDSKEIIIHIEKADDMARVSITDQGPGISSQKIPHLFDRYFRVDSSGSQYSGLGLGLYISSEIIKKHGGDIGVNSETGKGSTFWFTLPADD
ncbi:MAG TPA: HAMP domain-containing sensor histidine kinase [Sphingobacteriaceae bacterium]|nr:HAMP domain-containing sensor histidine kinase [Sphingobacteriaceae bacterium]